MKGDFTRDTFDAAKHFSRVLMQQGQVQLDADWNEQTSILLTICTCWRKTSWVLMPDLPMPWASTSLQRTILQISMLSNRTLIGAMS